MSPKWGVKRRSFRAASEAIKRFSYEGARRDRRTAGWVTSDVSANAAIGPRLSTLRQRSRDMVRNNGYASNALDELVAQCVGTGITAQAKPANSDTTLAKQINEAWKIWVDECDADGQMDFYGLQDMTVRSVIEAGEVLVRLRPRLLSDGLYIPFQLQVLEPDYIDTTKNEVLKNGGRIVQGVEFDVIGRRVAYWLYKNHPGDTLSYPYGDNANAYRVPAEYFLHIYRKKRPQQVRGVPWLAPVLIALRDMDEYRDAEIVRKKIEACFAAFVTQEGDPETSPIGEVKNGADGNLEEYLETGLIKYLKPGEDIKFATPSGSGDGYRDFMRDLQTGIATGIGLTYENFTGDLSNVSYSSYKAGENAFRTKIDAFRWLNLKPMLLQPVRQWFINYAYAAGRINKRDFGTEWSMPGFRSVDPQKDAHATLTKIRSGLMTLQQAIGEEGYDFDEQMADIKKANEVLDRLGISLDCDPRKRTAAGGAVTEQKESQEE